MELYDEIEELSQAEIEAGKEDEAKTKIAEKLMRFKNIVEQNTKLRKNKLKVFIKTSTKQQHLENVFFSSFPQLSKSSLFHS